jgi:hypothetical protein
VTGQVPELVNGEMSLLLDSGTHFFTLFQNELGALTVRHDGVHTGDFWQVDEHIRLQPDSSPTRLGEEVHLRPDRGNPRPPGQYGCVHLNSVSKQ